MNNEALHNWYLKGTVLHPAPHLLRQHATALADCHDSVTLEFHFTDKATITFSHAHLRSSPWEDLRIFTHMTVKTSSKPFHIIRQFIYCTPVDLSIIPVSLVTASWGWRLYELHVACFLAAETAQLTVVQLLDKYIPLIAIKNNIPQRFRDYFAGRVAVDPTHFRQWVNSNQETLTNALKQDLYETLINPFCLYSDLHIADIIPEKSHYSCRLPPEKDGFGLLWRVPFADVLASEQEYIETEVSTSDVSASMEVTWNTDGATLLVGIQRVETSGLVDVKAAVIGLPCACAHQTHNTGWQLDGGVQARKIDWVTSHEVAFTIFDDVGLREWRSIHKNCGILVKVRVVAAASDISTDLDGEAELTSTDDAKADEDVNG